MGRFAVGKYAYGISDRSGFRYRMKDMRKEWNGSLVGKDEYEPKHPQLEPLTATADPEALYKPRPNNDHEVGEGFVVVVNNDITRYNTMNPATLGTNFSVSEMTGGLGTVTIQIS